MSRPLAAAALAALVLLSAAPDARARPADEREVEKLNQEAEQIGKTVEGIRGLKFHAAVPKGIQTRDELRDFIMADFDKDMPEEKIRAIEKAYVKIGFFKRGLDLKKTLVDLYSEQIAAFYNPEKKELFLIEHGGEEQNMVMAHELTHALQDQNFDLVKLEKVVADNDDREIGLKSLIEGDATVVMIEYLCKERGIPLTARNLPDIGSTMTMLNDLGGMMGGQGGEVLKSAPKILTANLIFSYMAGATFCQKAVKRGGYEAVSKLFLDPPQSSEQIMHPEKYLGKTRDEPIEVLIPDLSAELGQGWKLLVKNVMGELNTSILFKEKLSESRSDMAAAGWGGDAWQAIEGPGGQVVFAWYSVWDTAKDAAEFADAYKDFAERRGDAARLEVNVKGDTVTIVDGHREFATVEKIRAAFAKAETHKGYGGAPVADAAPVAGLTRLGALTAPEGWSKTAPDDEAVKQAWRTPEGAEVLLIESATVRPDGVTVKVTAKDGRKLVQSYHVANGHQQVISVRGEPAAVDRAMADLEAANGGKLGLPKTSSSQPKHEPTLF